jgi:hypothetical protein
LLHTICCMHLLHAYCCIHLLHAYCCILITMLYMHYLLLHNITCITCITYDYNVLHALHRILDVVTNTRLNPEHFPSMSLRTMEQKLVKTIFPNGQLTSHCSPHKAGGWGPEDNIPLHPFHWMCQPPAVQAGVCRAPVPGVWATEVSKESSGPRIWSGELRYLVRGSAVSGQSVGGC